MDDEMISLMKDTAHYISVFIMSWIQISRSHQPAHLYECLGLVT
jgi:hypothetical protein